MFRINKFSTEKLLELLKDTCMKESFTIVERRVFGEQDDEYVKSNERDEIIAYVQEICDRDDMSLSVETFALCTSLVDRFLSNYKVKSKYLECLAIACLYIACKIKEEDENVSITSEFLLDCDCKCSISELLRMEQMILTKFEWSVNDTTSVDFLHIFYALLINKYQKQSVEQLATNSLRTNGNSMIWPLYKRSMNLSQLEECRAPQNIYKSMCPPPIDLDFLQSLESKLKQCLCSNELISLYKPHQLAYSLLSMQMDTCMETIESNQMKIVLNETLDLIRLMCKLNYELVDKCKEQIKCHLTSIENTKKLFDRYFNRSKNNASGKNSNATAASNIVTPRSYMLNGKLVKLSVIKEEDDEYEEEYEEEMIEDDLLNETSHQLSNKHNYTAHNQQIHFSSMFNFECSDTITPMDLSSSSSSSSLSSSSSSSTANNFFEYQLGNLVDDPTSMKKEIYFQQQQQQQNSHQFLSYAEILMGRKEQKRKLSENSNEELEY